MRMEKKVLNAMKKAGKPVRPGEVAKMLGEDSKNVSKAISELKKTEKNRIPQTVLLGAGLIAVLLF